MKVYHWDDAIIAMDYIRKNKMKARRWFHFIESENREVHGTSWSKDETLWRKHNDTCIVLDTKHIPNKIHSINGERTFLLTEARSHINWERVYGVMNPNIDIFAYQSASTEPDEEFIEGSINDLTRHIIEIRTTNPIVFRDVENIKITKII